MRMVYDLARRAYQHLWVLPRMHRMYGRLSPEEAFSRVYSCKAWGAAAEEPYYSGNGSSGQVADEYCGFVNGLIRDHGVRSVADLGCGDFRIGRRIVAAAGVAYVGVDVVPEVVEYCRERFSSEQVRFERLDILSDPLPDADLCLLRQVLQHLSNAEVEAALGSVGKYPLVLISEHVPVSPRSYN